MSAPVASTSATTRPTFFGLFDRPVTPERDIEAQLPQPTAARAHSARSASVVEEPVDPVDVFFGVSRSSPRSSITLIGTRDSRHDEVRRSTTVDVEALPPSYEDSVEPPAYTQVSDQPTLAMYLFKFGFCEYLLTLSGSSNHTLTMFVHSVPPLLGCRCFHPALTSSRTRGLGVD